MSAISERVSVTDFAEKNGLKIIYEGRGYVELSDISVSRPGLQLAGFFKNFAAKRVQLIGNAEYDYLANLKKEKRCEVCRKFLRTEDIPCLIVTNNLIPFEEVL